MNRTLPTTLSTHHDPFANYNNSSDRIEILKSIAAEDPSGDNLAMLGLAYFKSEQYDLAAAAYEAALATNPSHAEWKGLWQLCRGNALSEVHVPIPAAAYFDRDTLLAPAQITPGALPVVPAAASKIPTSKKWKNWIGRAVADAQSAGRSAGTCLPGIKA
ncbi:MAG: hypothetical protein INR73_01525 [Williamsia sp.]|nr:hypothetical protein [Williamsia sp.]